MVFCELYKKCFHKVSNTVNHDCSLIKIAVTGANGFVGRHLCRYLAEAGFYVVAIVRGENHVIEGAQEVQCVSDIYNASRILAALDGCQIIVNLAGRAHILRDSAKDPVTEFRKSNVDYTRALLKAGARAGVKRIVHVSSIGVNGNANRGQAFHETDIEQPYDAYTFSKLTAEMLVREDANGYGMEYVIVRPALIFGPDAPGNFQTLLKIAASNLPLPFGSFYSKRNILSIWNFLTFLEASAVHPAAAGETFLVADEQEVTLKHIFKFLRIGMSKRMNIFPFPITVIKYLAQLLGKKKAFEKLNTSLIIDIEKAKMLLSWHPPYDTLSALQRTGSEYEGISR